MELKTIDAVTAASPAGDGQVDYYPNLDGAHDKLERLAELKAVEHMDTEQAAELALLEAWKRTTPLYFRMKLITSVDLAARRAKSADLKISVKVNTKKESLDLAGGAEQGERRFAEGLLRELVTYVGNLWVTDRVDGEVKREQKVTIDDLFRALAKSDSAKSEIIDDAHRALRSLSHLERGLGN